MTTQQPTRPTVEVKYAADDNGQALAALARFLCVAADQAAPTKERQRAIEAAERELDEAGI